MPFVSIRYVKEVMGDSEEKKAKIAEQVTSVISEAAGIDPVDVWVTFEPIPAAHWYLGPDSAEKRRGAAQ